MTRPKVPRIDFGRQFKALEPFLGGKGGVVHVRSKLGAPVSSFVRLMRSRMEYEEWPRKWLSIQIDGENSATHYLCDMVAQLETSLGLRGHEAADALCPGVVVTVGSNNEAGHSVSVSGTTVNVPNPARPGIGQITKRVQAIREHVARQQGELLLCVVVLHTLSSDERELRAFVDTVWESSLSSLSKGGALLVYCPPEGRAAPSWAPAPCEVLELPAEFDALSVREAIEDLTAVALAEGLFRTREESVAFARTVVSAGLSPRDLYAELSAILARMRVQHDSV